jgi:hypothetical protein
MVLTWMPLAPMTRETSSDVAINQECALLTQRPRHTVPPFCVSDGASQRPNSDRTYMPRATISTGSPAVMFSGEKLGCTCLFHASSHGLHHLRTHSFFGRRPGCPAARLDEISSLPKVHMGALSQVPTIPPQTGCTMRQRHSLSQQAAANRQRHNLP